jgi:hypothetical protein
LGKMPEQYLIGSPTKEERIMDWMSSRVDSWTRFIGITCVILVLFLIISCNPSTFNNQASSTDTPMPVTTIALVSIATPVQPSIPESATRMPTPTDTPIPTYLALTLVNPAYGATIVGKEKTEFSWMWDGDLQEEEEFDLRIWRREESPSTFAIGCDCSVLIDTPPDGFGDYLWQVALVRTDKDGNKSILSESQIRPFVWNDAPPSPTFTSTYTPAPTFTYTPTATPTPANTSTPTVTPTPTPYPAPVLTSPDNGSGVQGEFPPLYWNWDGKLGEDEFFEVRVWHEDITTYHPALGWVKVPQFDYNVRGERKGKYYWTVIVVKGANPKPKDWTLQPWWPYPMWEGDLVAELSHEPEPRFFMFTPDDGGGPGGPISVPSTPCSHPGCKK